MLGCTMQAASATPFSSAAQAERRARARRAVQAPADDASNYLESRLCLRSSVVFFPCSSTTWTYVCESRSAPLISDSTEVVYKISISPDASSLDGTDSLLFPFPFPSFGFIVTKLPWRPHPSLLPLLILLLLPGSACSVLDCSPGHSVIPVTPHLFACPPVSPTSQSVIQIHFDCSTCATTTSHPTSYRATGFSSLFYHRSSLQAAALLAHSLSAAAVAILSAMGLNNPLPSSMACKLRIQQRVFAVAKILHHDTCQ